MLGKRAGAIAGALLILILAFYLALGASDPPDRLNVRAPTATPQVRR